MHNFLLILPLSACLLLVDPSLAVSQAEGSQAEGSQAEGSQAGEAQSRASQAADLIRRGRVMLDAGDAAAAQVLFEQAAAKDSDSLSTRMWVLRAWMEQGRLNDSLDALDELKRGGQAGPILDYLYGMAFVLRAQTLIAESSVSSGLPRNTIQMNITSGYEHLTRALPADQRLFRDGWISLARAGWHEAGVRTDPEDARAVRAVARDAGERAVAFYPSHVDAHLMLGRVALSQFISDMPEGAETPDQWGPAAPH